MAREKRQLHTQKSSKPIWPWLLGAVLVLVLLGGGIGLGVLLSGGLKDDPNPIGPIAKNEVEDNGKDDGPGADPVTVVPPNGNAKGGGGNGDNPEPPKANPQLYEFFKDHRVYLVPTKAGQAGILGNDPRMKTGSSLGAFFRMLKEHNNANKLKRNPDKFETATYVMGPDPRNLNGEKSIPYIPNGGTQVRPVQYDLGPVTALADKLTPASKPAGIYFNYLRSDQGQWTYIKGKSIEPFYLVPVETGRYPPLVTLNVAAGIEFDDETMTAGVNIEITEAIKKLIKDSNSPTKIMLRAGAPLATWGLAHVNTTETIDFKKAHLDPQKAVAMLRGNNPHLAQYEKWTNDAISYYFPAAQAVVEAKKRKDLLKALEKTAAYTEISLRFVKGGSSVPGLDDHKADLTKDAIAIAQGQMTLAAARKSWEAKMKEMKVAGANAEAAKWDDKQHQQAEWERFKKHPVFYLAGSMGVGDKALLPLVLFNQ